MARAEVSNFRVEFEILLKRIRVEDAEAYQKMMRMKYEPFSEIFTTILVMWPFAISIWAHLWQSWWPKKLYHSLYSARSNSKTIINYHVKFEDVQTTW